MTRNQNGPLAPRIPFYTFATKVCGINEPDSKVQLTPAQRAIFKSYDRSIALTAKEGETYRQLTGKSPWRVGDKAHPFLLMTLTRGGGKSLLMATIAGYEAVTNSYKAAPGETVAVVALAPRVRQAKDMVGYAKAHFARPELSPFVKRIVADEIELTNGRLIRILAVDKSGGAARGPTYITALFDESAFLGFDGKIVDRDQWQAIIAGARGVEDFHGVLSSTPNGQSGFFWETFSDSHGRQGGAWEVFHGPQPIVRPDMPPELLQEYQRADPEAFKREFLCDFSAGTGTEKFFNKNQIEACVQTGVVEIPPGGPTVQYACAVDPTGGTHDRMTMTVVERLPDGQVRQCMARGWDPKESAITVHDIAKEIAGLVAPFGVYTVYGDVFGGNWVGEAFRAAGLEYETRGFNGQQKVQRASLLRELFATGRIQLLDEPIQTRELKEYEKKTLSSGQVSVNHPNTKDGSDDYLDALALAAWELVGHDVELHPPENLKRWNSKKWKGELFTGGRYPELDGGLRGRGFVTVAEVCARGEGPRWVLQNWSKDWRYCQCAPGELAWLMGLTPVGLMGLLGRDLLLQLVWARWILSYFSETEQKLDTLFATKRFPGIPGFAEVQRRILDAGSAEDIVTYEAIGPEFWEPGDLLPYDFQVWGCPSFDPSKGVSSMPACPPWSAPDPAWGINHNVEEIYGGGWPDRPWAREVEEYFQSIKGKKAAAARSSRILSRTGEQEESNETVLKDILERVW